MHCNPFSITNGIFHWIKTKIFSINTETQKPWIVNVMLRRKNGAGGITFPDFRLYYKVTVIKTAWCWHKSRNTAQWNKVENPETKLCTYGYLIFDKGGKTIQWGKDSFFNKWCWKNWKVIHKRMNLEHFLTLYTKINMKWIKGLSLRPETIKLLET